MDKVDCLKEIISTLNGVDPDTIEGDTVCELLTKISDVLGGVKFADDSKVVHKSGDENIGGVKTFVYNPSVSKNLPTLELKDISLPALSAPTDRDRYTKISSKDKDGNERNHITMWQLMSGDGSISLSTYNADKTASAEMKVVAENDGTKYATAPTTPNSAVGNEIVTVDYLLAKLATLEARISSLEGTS